MSSNLVFTQHKQLVFCFFTGESDTHDGNSAEIPFHEKTKEEKEEMYGKVAEKIAEIGDHLNAEYMSDQETRRQEAGGQAMHNEGNTHICAHTHTHSHSS